MPILPTRYGPLAVPEGEDLIGTFLASYGEWAWLETAFVSAQIADGARVLDGGAFLGTFGLGLSMVRRLGALCLVEANPEVLPLLRQNMVGHPATVVAALVAAPGVPAGPGVLVPGNLAATSYGAGGQGAVPATTVTLTALRAAHGPFDLIKLDVEGMELDILRSDAPGLRSDPAVLWLECNQTLGSLEMADLLLGWGRTVHYYAWPSFNPANAFGQDVPLLPCAHEAGLLALPAGSPAPTLAPGLLGILEPIGSPEDLRTALWRTPRWGLAEWDGASAPALQAMAGHYLCGEDRATFLQPGLDPPTPSWEQLKAALARAEAAEAALARLRP